MARSNIPPFQSILDSLRQPPSPVSSPSIFPSEPLVVPSYQSLVDSLSLPPPGPPHTLFPNPTQHVSHVSTKGASAADITRLHLVAHDTALALFGLPQSRPEHWLACAAPPELWAGHKQHGPPRLLAVTLNPAYGRSGLPAPLSVRPVRSGERCYPGTWMAYVEGGDDWAKRPPGDASNLFELSVLVRSVAVRPEKTVIALFDARHVRIPHAVSSGHSV
ncbi:hypothetical protein BV25DRAFT_1826131 [Artomyces pyxidatus]|uniref:Uncharacterized protein n=1 Tax=Artomyces pyxidatus TaxID=48021 RepID=A0ACB8T166_9AGAM|nr:hypothetical protein BV25DRAFT_1826131 [Artomyces pyxidatus]